MVEETNPDAGKQIGISKIYVKDFSFESPKAPDVFRSGEWNPHTDLNLRSSHKAIEGEEALHEVVLTITVEAKQDEQTMFLAEVQQAGLFQIDGYDQEEFSAIVGSFCPNILFPYARESIAGMIQKGGFPEFVLQPINFDALYLQAKQQQQAQGAAAEAH